MQNNSKTILDTCSSAAPLRPDSSGSSESVRSQERGSACTTPSASNRRPVRSARASNCASVIVSWSHTRRRSGQDRMSVGE
eukprot:3503689-Rhodomonas_salina.3